MNYSDFLAEVQSEVENSSLSAEKVASEAMKLGLAIVSNKEQIAYVAKQAEEKRKARQELQKILQDNCSHPLIFRKHFSVSQTSLCEGCQKTLIF